MAEVVPKGTTFKDIKASVQESHVESALEYLIKHDIKTKKGILYDINESQFQPRSEARALQGKGRSKGYLFGVKAIVRVAYLYSRRVSTIEYKDLKEVYKIPYSSRKNSKVWAWNDARDLLKGIGFSNDEAGDKNFTLDDIKREHVERALDYIAKYGKEKKGLLHIPFHGEGAYGKGKPQNPITARFPYEGKNFWVKDVVRIAYLYFDGINPSPEFRQEDIARSKIIKTTTVLMKKFLNKIMKYTSQHADKEKSPNDEKLPGDDEKLPEIFQHFHQIIFYGPPGTGKTYEAKKLVAEVFGVDKKGFLGLQGIRWNIVQFHPSYNYEDFVRGVKVKTDDKGNIAYETGNRIFGDMCQRAQDNPNNKYVLIIDEINRANVSAVLGELIYALEYRGEKIKTPYAVDDKSGEKADKRDMLVIPKNLYIIGTMNTADRTIGQIDYAVRRRFAFVHCPPAEKNITDRTAKEFFHLVEDIFGNHISTDYDVEDVRIGHSYFMASGKKLAGKIIYQVVPILREYVKDGVLLGESENDASEIWWKYRGAVTNVDEKTYKILLKKIKGKINMIEEKAKNLSNGEMENESNESADEEQGE